MKSPNLTILPVVGGAPLRVSLFAACYTVLACVKNYTVNPSLVDWLEELKCTET